ncbi:hypothetical protein M2164_000293 [Streptomyces sp. SAI-208]|nr:hypothetical protein [Streptomyces sp. SAI-090]MDH6545983.1 hypothetical protein [Streptomyces sp. SAI-041]MDH6565070.1 hypothetical protein [Streptomyces sp. SAI-117]MDH6604658.1 hypothetical protein [Streptomyces sp. SAI-208]MDH6622110.1 hypothetical protein [Streptomyces sp. SAI-135]
MNVQILADPFGRLLHGRPCISPELARTTGEISRSRELTADLWQVSADLTGIDQSRQL